MRALTNLVGSIAVTLAIWGVGYLMAGGAR
jgi:hypothetical protein